MAYLSAGVPCTSSQLRRELSARGREWARHHPHDQSFSSTPSFLFHESDGKHGNFYPDSFGAIAGDPSWSQRLLKSYSGDKSIPRRHDRKRRELDCACSSDALLMNIFCYPRLLEDWRVRSLLGTDSGARPEFGYRPNIPMSAACGRRTDRTEIDMKVGSLLVEAKLTETNFQRAAHQRLIQYRDFSETFDRDRLPFQADTCDSYQLVRGVLAAAHHSASFVVLLDCRRDDLIKRWYQVLSAVRTSSLRSRLALLTWQEMASVVPEPLQHFLAVKYGILATS